MDENKTTEPTIAEELAAKTAQDKAEEADKVAASIAAAGAVFASGHPADRTSKLSSTQETKKVTMIFFFSA